MNDLAWVEENARMINYKTMVSYDQARDWLLSWVDSPNREWALNICFDNGTMFDRGVIESAMKRKG